MPPTSMIDRLTSLGRDAQLWKLPKRLGRWGGDLLWRIRIKMAAIRARWREPRLFNAAYRQPAWQSSTRGRQRRHGAHRATDGRAGGRGFSLTKREERPWWMVELEADWPIHSIRIHGRRDWARRIAAIGLQVSLSPDREQWETVHSGLRLLGDTASPGPLVIRLLDTRGARFVKLELPEGGELALNQIEIMVARRHLPLWRVACRYGFAFERMTSLRMRRHVKPYSVQRIPSRFDGEIQALHIAYTQGRFGNHLQMVGKAVCLARRLGIPRIYVTKLTMLEIDRPIRFGDVTLLSESELRRDKPHGVLCGTFNYGYALGRAFEGVSFRDVAEAARAVGQPMFRRLAVPPPFMPGATDLVIHLRAGDIFVRPQPDSGYVQPPLAFYRLCVEFARAQLGVERTILIYEDEGNPCIAGLKSWLDQIDFPYVAETRRFEEDLAIMLAASHCVFGRGTLGRAVAILSDNMRTVFHTWLEPSFGAISEVTGVRTVMVEDVVGGYIKRDDWRNTPEQKQMMLDYPVENLRLKAD